MAIGARRLRWLRWITGAGALAALLGVGAARMVYRSGQVLSDARGWARLGPAEARRRVFGAAYTDAVGGIRRALPEDAWYLLMPAGQSEETGWALWVRYDLAPRRPILIESEAPRGARVPKWVRWAVLPDDHGVPLLLTREDALARLKVRAGR